MKKTRIISLVAMLMSMCMLLIACASNVPAATEAAPAEAAAPTEAAATGQDATTVVATAEDPVKIAFVVPYELDSLPWLIEFCTEIPAYDEAHDEVEMTIVEALSADQYEPLLRSFCEDGYKMIFAFYNNFTEPVKILSAEYPDVLWFAFDGYYGEELLSQLPRTVDFHENLDHSFLSGACAALMSKTGKIAFVFGADIEFNTELAAAFQRGAVYVKPDIEFTNVVTNTYVDPQVGYETAKSLISRGYDVICANAGTTESGLVQACHEAGIYYVADSTTYVGTEYGSVELCTRRADVDAMHIYMVDMAMAGNFKGGECIYIPADSGTSYFVINEATVPADVVAKLKDLEAKIESGEIVVDLTPIQW